MIGEKLVVVGGVWLHSEGVPGVVMINLSTCSSVEFSLDTVSSHLLDLRDTDFTTLISVALDELMHPPQVAKAWVCCPKCGIKFSM